MRPLLILFILVIGHVASEDILFNTSSTGCEGPIGCNWNDPAIWVGGRVPSSEADSVHLNDTRPNILVIFNNSSPNIYINSVVVAGVTFGIQNASLSLNTLVVEDSTVSLGQNSSLYSYESITVQYNSTITLDGSALYLVESATGFVLDNSSQLHSGLGSKLILYGLVTIDGVLEMDASSTFEGGSVEFGRSITVSNTPHLQSAIFKESTNGTFLSGLFADAINLASWSFVSIYGILGVVKTVDIQYGSILYLRSVFSAGACIQSFAPTTGTLVVSSSNVTIANANTQLNTNLILAGRVVVLFSAIQINRLGFATGEFGEQPYVYIRVTIDPVIFQLEGLSIPGEVEVDNAFISFSGESSISGGIQSVAGTVVLEGKFTAGSSIVMITALPLLPSIFLRGHAVVTTPLLHLQKVSELFNNDNTTLIGNLQNDGIISNFGHNTLTIFGNYTQTENGQLMLADIDPLTNKTGLINITGYASIAGFVVYSVENSTNHEGELKFPILYASEGVHGKFRDQLNNDGPGNVSVMLEYSDSFVYFIYGANHQEKKEEKFLGLEWWSWTLITLAVLVVVFLIPLTYYQLRIKGRYEPIVEELRT